MSRKFPLTATAALIGALLSVPVSAIENLADFHSQSQECNVCHLPSGELSDDNLSHENAQCQSCHGNLAEMAKLTQRANYNAHDSHFPGEPACTTCHQGHSASLNYCDSCHSFEFNLPYAGKWQRDEASIAELAADKQAREQALAAEPAAVVDVVVIGSGGAGFSAAVAAHDQGAKVILVEKEPVIGGNAKLAAGGMNAAQTTQQQAKGIKDSFALMTEDTLKGGRNINDPALVKVLVEHSPASVQWLTDMGADLSDVGRMGGASVNRTHRPTGGAGVGAHVVQVLYDNALKRQLDLRMNTRAVEVLKQDDGSIKGLLVKGAYKGYYWIKTDAIVLATGGFGKNNTKVAQYDASLKGFKSTNQPGATGDGIDVATNAGGTTVDMQYVQAHPTLSTLGGVMVTEAVRGNGAILVNREGQRFVNELTTRDKASAAILSQTGDTAFLVFDDSIRKSLKKIEKYIKLGIVPQGDTPQQLADKIGLNGANLAASIQRYNELVATGSDADFARQQLPRALAQGPYYAIEVNPGVHHTMGGVKINDHAQVMDNQGKAIKGLYAAGEVTGGVHGANRLGGNAISDIVTFGRLAGEQAAAFAKP